MNAIRSAGALLIAGSVVFLVGAQLGVPRVFTERDPERRLRLLQDSPGRWRAAQPLYVLGPLVTALGTGVVAGASASGSTRVMFWLATGALLGGALSWTRSVYLRMVRVSDFALGRLPNLPFVAYVLLTTGGLAALGVGLLAGGGSTWLAIVVLASSAVFLALYARFGDIPPFVFYILLLIVGLDLVASPGTLGS